MATPSKPKRGRGRLGDEAARRRILQAALDLMDETAFTQVTMEAIAERAAASKTTVYRWWPNKAQLAIEAFREAVAPELPLRDTGSLRNDLTTQMQNFARVLSGRGGDPSWWRRAAIPRSPRHSAP